MAKKKTYSLTYDKYVPNQYGGVDIVRATVRSADKKTAVKVMKNDLYNHGCYGGQGVVRYQNGRTERLQPRKCPVITMDETLKTSVKRERMNVHWFGNFDKRK